MLDDLTLLRQFVAGQFDAPFTELVRRYLDMVYSAALRRVEGNAALAQDIAQIVFTDLARKAHRLPANVVLAAWLHRATRLAAAAAVRAEVRRSAREQHAMAMQELDRADSPAWDAMRPLLDEVLDSLNARDREAVLLRFFQQHSLREIGALFGLSEDAARMRVERALQRLRDALERRGIASTADALAPTLTAYTVQAAPVGMAAKLASASLAATASVPASALTLKLAQIMTATKLKAAIAVLLAATAATTVIVEHQHSERLKSQLAALQAETARVQPAAATAPPKPATQTPSDDHQFLEILRLRGQVGVMRRQLEELKLQLGNGGRPRAQEKPTDTPLAAQANRYYPAENWGNVGYRTPEAAALTFFWALRNGDQGAYSGALGKEMPPVPEQWAKAFRDVKGAYISGIEQSPNGELVVSATQEKPDGQLVNTFISYRQADGQWLIHSLSGFPIEMLVPTALNEPPHYSLPAEGSGQRQ